MGSVGKAQLCTQRSVFPVASAFSVSQNMLLPGSKPWSSSWCGFGSLQWVGQEGQAGGPRPWADLGWPLASGTVYVLRSGLRAGNSAGMLQGDRAW